MLDEIQKRELDLEREVAERRRSEQEIARLNAELEDRVRERTAQLEASNRNWPRRERRPNEPTRRNPNSCPA